MRPGTLLALLLSLTSAAQAEPDETAPCELRLAAIARYTPLPPREEPAPCAADDLIRLERIVMPDRTPVVLNPPATLRCAMAETVALWIRTDVGPLAAGLGARLAAITSLDSYECRPRNRIAGGKISEHGKGNALDIGAIKLGNGGTFSLTDPLVQKPFRDELRASACARFTTVLGPGSDGYHNDHIHLDIAERSRGYRICQWNVLEPISPDNVPLPRSKPAELVAAQSRK
jgi:hypothetical protein